MGLETGVVESNEIATLVVHKSDSVGRETLQQDLPELVGLQIFGLSVGSHVAHNRFGIRFPLIPLCPRVKRYRETYRVEEPLQPTIGTDIERTS